MFSADELNKAMRMKYPQHKIVSWSPIHDRLIEMNDFDLRIRRSFPEFQQTFLQYAEVGTSFTGIGDGRIYAMFGAYEYWPGVSEAWLIPSKDLSSKTISFHRAALRFFDLYCQKTRTKRLQVTVHALNVHAVEWIKRCYFEHEGTLRCYGPDGSDYEMFARIST
jgi:hypothetical protein